MLIRQVHIVNMDWSPANTTLCRLLGTSKTQHAPRGVWNGVARYLGPEFILFGLLNRGTADEPIVHDIVRTQVFPDEINGFLSALKQREELLHLLRRLHLEHLSNSPILKYHYVKTALREFAKAPDFIPRSSPEYATNLTNRFNVMIKLFRFTPSQPCLLNNRPLRERHPEQQRIFNFVALLFVEWNRCSGIPLEEMSPYVAITTGVTSRYGKRNQWIYRVVAECRVQEHCPEELKPALVVMETTWWGRRKFHSRTLT